MPSLSAPLFVSIADVASRMQLDTSLDGTVDIVTSGIIGAQMHVERILGAKLSKKSRDCTYYLDGDAFSGIQPGGVFRLELPAPFIRTDSAVTVSVSGVNTSLNVVGPFGDLTALNSAFYRVDNDRGYVLIDASWRDTFVKVQCVTGFEDGTTPLPTTGIPDYDNSIPYTVGQQVVFAGKAYTCTMDTTAGQDPTNAGKWALAYVPIEQIPVEIYESILALVPMVFNANQTTNRSAEAEKQYKVGADHANLLLQPFVRTKGFSFRPLW